MIAALAEVGLRHREAPATSWTWPGKPQPTSCSTHLRSPRRSTGCGPGRAHPCSTATGEARHLAYAGDYAALVDAFTRLAEASGEARWITEARDAADGLLDLFWDEDLGGVFTAGDDAPPLVTRQKDFLDNATPSANSAAALALLRLGALTGSDRYRDRAAAILTLFGPLAEGHPTAFAHLLAAVDLYGRGLTQVVVAGDRPDLVDVVRASPRADLVVAWGERYDSPLWVERTDGQAYVCRDYTCNLPATTVDDLRAQLA